MTEEVRRQALEPFFTTRPPGEGSGLGLAIVAAIVHGHQGQVSVDSEPAVARSFELRLPLKGDLAVTAG